MSAEEIIKGFTNPSTMLGFKFHLLTRMEEFYIYIYINLKQCTTAVQCTVASNMQPLQSTEASGELLN
jgi:hypothetical protein